MKLKKVISICLVGVMAATLLAGCSSSEDTSGAEEEAADEIEEEAEVVEDASEDAEEADEADEAEEADEAAVEEAAADAEESSAGFEGFDNMITISAYCLTMTEDDNIDAVIDAVNEITEAEINVHVDLNFLDLGAFTEQIPLMLAGGESMDLLQITAISGGFSTMTSQNQLMDISSYVDEYAPEMIDIMSDYLEATTVGDALYGVGNLQDYVYDQYIIMRKDILDYLDLTEQAQAISSWSDFEDIMLAVYDAQDELPEELQTNAEISQSSVGSLLGPGVFDLSEDNFDEHVGYDGLADNLDLIAVNDNGEVINWYTTDEYAQMIDMVNRWYAEDLVYKDSQTSAETGDLLLSEGITFAETQPCQLSAELDKRTATGYDVVCVPYVHIPIQTSNLTYWGWGVPVTADEPEAAVAVMNLLFSNEDICNLLTWGIEGYDYELNDEGEAVLLEHGTNTGKGNDWLYGNQFLCYPKEGAGADYREESYENLKATEPSQFFGCTIDTDPISNEITAVSSVIDQYRPGLESGTSDPSLLDDFISALDAAGAQIIVDEYQSQLDAWLAEK